MSNERTQPDDQNVDGVDRFYEHPQSSTVLYKFELINLVTLGRFYLCDV